MKSYNKIGIILIIIATFLSLILIPYMDSEIEDLEKDIIFFKEAIEANFYVYLQNIIIENRIETMFLSYNSLEISNKDKWFNKIVTSYIKLGKVYLAWFNRDEELEIPMEKLQEKIESVNNSSKKDYEKINDINAIVMKEKDKGMNRLFEIQNNLKELQNNLNQKKFNRKRTYFSFSFFQIIGVSLISLKSILK